jgi:EmrB/QacA subfamily drug resistance transporter
MTATISSSSSSFLQRNRSNVMLAAVCIAQFMVILDIAIVNVALPSIRDGLHFSPTGLQWVVNAYTLTFAGFLMLGGRAADLLGRRRVLLSGVALFALCSLLCALASSRGMLLGARALQGVAGAIVSPATLSIISSSLPEGPQRNRALGIWAAIGGLGATSGALLGGIFTQAFGWPAIFAVNVPLGVVAVVLGLRVIPAHTPEDLPARRHFDISGAVLVTAALAIFTFGIVRSDALSWGSPGVLGPLAAGVALFAAFLYVEARVAEVPLVPLSIFRMRRLSAANVVVVLLYMAVFSMWYFLTLYMQTVRHDDALAAGLSFAPMTLMVFGSSSLAPRFVRRFGVARVAATGMAVSAAGLAVLAGVTPSSSFVALVLPGGMLASIGMGLTLVSSTVAAMQGVEQTHSGIASGLLNTSRLIGGALGLAILGTLAQSRTRGLAGSVGALHAATDGYQLAFTIGSILCLLGAGVAVSLLRSPAVAAVTPLPTRGAAEIERARAA